MKQTIILIMLLTMIQTQKYNSAQEITLEPAHLAIISPVNAHQLEPLLSLEADTSIAKLALAQLDDTYHLVVALDNGRVEWRDTNNPDAYEHLGQHDGVVISIALSHNNEVVATGGRDGVINMWNLRTTEQTQFVSNYTTFWEIAFSSTDANILASAEQSGTVIFWDTQTGEIIDSIASFIPFTGVDFAPDGTLVAVGDPAGVRFLDFPSLNERWDLAVIDTPVAEVAFSFDGESLIVNGDDGSVTVWNLENETSTTVASGIPIHMSVSPIGNILFIGNSEGIFGWNLESLQNIGEIPVESDQPSAMTFSTDGKLIVVGYKNGVIEFWGIPVDS